MNLTRIALAALGGFVAYFVVGFAAFGLFPTLRNEFLKYPTIYRTQDAMKGVMPMGMAFMFLAIVALAVLYAMLGQNISGSAEGLRVRLYNGGDSVAGSVFLPGRLALAAPNPIRDETKTSGRRKAVIALAIGAFLLLAILVLQASFNLKFISPDSNEQLLFFAGLSGLIFFAFVALTIVLGRNLLKLYAERRQGVAGSKFRTRLVVVSLLLSFLPVIAMFWFSYGLMNRSIDKWFSQPVEEVRADTAAMSALLYDYAGQNAASEAQSIAQTEEFQKALAGGIFPPLNEELREHIPTLQGGFVRWPWRTATRQPV
jgi:hypothetical protein